jgi:hypothetical protein
MEEQMHESFVQLLEDFGTGLGVEVLTTRETSLRTPGIRPDLRVDVAGTLVGYVELKRPGRPIPTTGTLDKTDQGQWEKLQLLPNVLYSNGEQWALFRYGQLVGRVARLTGGLAKAGSKLTAEDDEFTRVLSGFLLWHPDPPRTVTQLARTVASLCRLLRSEVTDALARERSGEEAELIFSGLAADWRMLLFPGLSGGDFADAYAQTVTFALLLARVDGIDFEGKQLPEIASLLGERHSLMGKALAVLTEEIVERSVAVTTLLRVIGPVNWDQLGNGDADAYLHLYEHFLGEYDQKRMRSGSYYTPNDVVSFMVRFVEEVLRVKMGRSRGLASDDVVITDPAMGTGTFLLSIIDSVAATITVEEGPAAVPPQLRALLGRLIGFEKQTGPYTVAELRVHQALKVKHGTEMPEKDAKLYVVDTLADPYAEPINLPQTFDPIARSRSEANKINKDQPVHVVMGNPPYQARAKGTGGWIEHGDSNSGSDAPMQRFRTEGNGQLEHVLSDAYVYFWRWATWKVFDAHPEHPSGIVAFITPSSYTTGQGYAGMREYLRRTADEGWIIDLAPEGHLPDVGTRVFPGLQSKLCVGVFARYGPGDPDHPAQVHHLSVGDARTEKLARLERLQLDDPDWTDCGIGWQDRLTPAENAAWTAFPVLSDLFPWHASGVRPGRTWVYSPDVDTLRRRWDLLIAARLEDKPALFKESRDRNIVSVVQGLPGLSRHEGTIRDETGTCPQPVRVGYRSFDRQWILPDNRFHDRPGPDLWRIHGDKQVYAVTQHAQPLTAGPGLVFSACIPDMDHFMGRHGGQVLPLYRDAAGQIPNVSPGLCETIAERLQIAVPTAEDLLAYVACVVAHPGYTTRFREELKNPGIRVPLTADPALWAEAVTVGRQLIWLHSYGERFVDRSAGRPSGSLRLLSGQRPITVQTIPGTPDKMPKSISYDPDTETLHVGEGQIRPVPPRVWEYEVSGMKIVRKWFDYRKENPSGRRSSPLDAVGPNRWPSKFTTELLDLLDVLGRCAELEPAQKGILDRICQRPVIAITDLTQAQVLPVKDSTRKPVSPDEQPTLVPDSREAPIPAFGYVESGELDRYVREFAAGTPELDAALSAGRLPFPPALAERSPDLAGLAARIWRLTSIDSPAYSRLFEVDKGFHDALLPGAALPAGIGEHSGAPTASESPPAARRRRSHAQAEGALLEQGMLRVFERLFRIEAGNWQAETGNTRRPRPQVRRQRSGTQNGADIVIRFKGAAIGASSTCLVECKNYAANSSGLTVSAVADKVLQAEARFGAEPVDHWILVSPDLDPSNELDGLAEHWNATQKFPFTVQIWSPQTGIRDLFTLDPDIYRSLYSEDPPESRRDAADIVAEFSERLRPPVRQPEQLRRYVQDPRSFVEPNEQEWLDQLPARIERFGFDEKGARLGHPLETEILSVLADSPRRSNVALLLADFGEGKSFFTVSLCVRLQKRYLEEPRSGSPIPVRLHLRGYRHVSAPADFLRTQLGLLGLSMADWAELRRGNVLVVLDGLDEMSVRQDPATTRANLDNIGSLLEVLEGLPVLVTSRPHFFASNADRKRLYDRLRRPHVFRMRQPDRRDTVAHLRAYADSLDLASKLNKIKEFHDPIGLAGKVLFLEMIKKTLPALPEDHFDELVLYETYVEESLSRKLELLRDPASDRNEADLLDSLEKLLEKIAVAIHVSGEGSVDLREFVADSGGAARLLWNATQLDPAAGDSDDDASARIGSRSLLRRVPSENESRWLVDFFHRSMKEYFVAKALRRALNAPDPFAATRELLLSAPVQPEILGFFRLLAGADQNAATVLASLAHSARVGSGQGTLGGGAISLYHAAGGQFAGSDWKSLQLDGALLAGADLSDSDFRGSTIRSADLSSANLTGADLRSADLTGANLDAGGTITGLAADASAHRFLYVTKDCELGWISVRADASLKFSVISLPRALRRPENVYLLREDIVMVTARSEILIADISDGTATEVAYFRVSSDLRAAAVVDQKLLGLIIEPEYAESEALLIDIESGQVRWRISVPPGGRPCGWFTHGIVMASDSQLLLLRENGDVEIRLPDLEPSPAAICVHDDQAILVSEYGRETWLPLNNSGDPECTLVIHSGAGTAVTAMDGQVLSSGTDGSVVLTGRDAKGVPAVVAREERRLRCDRALVEAMKSDRELAIFTANGAH